MSLPFPVNSVVCSDWIEFLRQLPDESVQCCVTSPPYWGLRDYGNPPTIWDGDPACEHRFEFGSRTNETNHTGNARWQHTRNGRDEEQPTEKRVGWLREVIEHGQFCRCGAWRGCLGLEPTPEMFVDHIVEGFREVRRVLRKDGTLWLNLGDSYAAGGNGCEGKGWERGEKATLKSKRAPVGLKPKDLCGIPWMVAFAFRVDGWYLRQDIVWCLSGGSWVYARTQKGDMPIMVRDLARLKPETVKLWNGQKWTQALGWSKSKRCGRELEIVLRSGERISCTDTHQWPTNRGLLAAGELRKGDILGHVTLPEPDRPLDTLTIGADVAWFVGLYIAEGSRSEDTIQIAGHAKESARLERLQRLAKEWGGAATFDTAGNKQSIRLYGKMLNALVDQFVSGKTAHDKCLAPICWRYSNAWIRSLLDGYLSGDGAWDDPNNRWRLGFCRNYNLERDLRTIAARLGLRLVLKPTTVAYKGTFRPSFRGELRFRFGGHGNCKSTGEIVEIRKARCREVYDIGVEDEPHTYALASGILTHNSKPNPMPESVTDRCTKAHEYLFLLTKSERYFCDMEAIKEPSSVNSHARGDGVNPKAKATGQNSRQLVDRDPAHLAAKRPKQNESFSGAVNELVDSRNKRSVWEIATAPFPEAHFATFPPNLVEPCILAGTSEKGCCPECGAPWERVTESSAISAEHQEIKGKYSAAEKQNGARRMAQKRAEMREITGQHDVYFMAPQTLGWEPTCTCKPPLDRMLLVGEDKNLLPPYEPVPCVVMDPFSGAGTVKLVAIAHGRQFIGAELNPEYIEISNRRTWSAEHGGMKAPDEQQAGLFEEARER